MPAPNTRNAGLALQVYSTSAIVPGLRIVGTLTGVVIQGAACRNGPGTGILTLSPQGTLSWQAPGSGAAGTPQPVLAGGAYMVEDGDDPSQWVAVEVYPTYLTTGQAQISFEDAYATGPTEADVTAANASAGYVLTVEYTLVNVTANALTAVKLWLDPTASGFAGLTVSQDGTNYYQPIGPADSHALSWAAVAPGAALNLWVKRTTAAAAASNPGLLNVLQWGWMGIA